MIRNFAFQRDPRRGLIAGVCAGFAGHFQVSVLLIRVLFVGLTIFSGIFPAVIAYIVLAFMVPAKVNPDTWSQGDHYRRPDPDYPSNDPSAATSRYAADPVVVEHRLQLLSQRIERLESYLVSDAYQVDREFNKLRG